MNDKTAAPPRLMPGLDLKLLAAAVLVLAVALLSVNFGYFWFETPRMIDYYSNYSLGYVHRGLGGTVYQWLYGAPTDAGIRAFDKQYGIYRIVATLSLFWLIFMVPLVRGRVPRKLRWLLFAFAALLLVAPVWRYQNFDRSFDPLYTFFAILALVCLVRNRPLLFIASCFIGQLIHPQMLIWDALLSVLVLHACFTSERHFAKWRWWLGSCAAVFLCSLLLYFLSDPMRSVELLRSLGFGPPALLEQLMRDFLSPWDNNRRKISALWSGHPSYQLTILAVYLGLMLVPAMLVGFCCAGRWRRRPLAHRFASWGLSRWAIRNDFYLLMLAGAVCFLPAQLTNFDWQRLILLGYWGMAIVLAYLLAMPSSRNVDDESAEASGQLLLRHLATACIAVLAYAFSGMKMVDAGNTDSWIYSCKKNCVAFLTDNNPLGERLADAIFRTVVNRTLPLQLDAEAIRDKEWFLHGLEVKDGVMVVPDGKNLNLIHHQISTLVNDPNMTFKLLATVEYESQFPPPLELRFKYANMTEYNLKHVSGLGKTSRRVQFDSGLPFALTGISDTQANWELDVTGHLRELLSSANARDKFVWDGEVLFFGLVNLIDSGSEGLRIRSFRLEVLENEMEDQA